MLSKVLKDSTEEDVSVPVSTEEKEPSNISHRGHTPRVLIFTKDQSILDEDSVSFRRISGLKDVFHEVHIVILSKKTNEESSEVIRPSKNIWLYQTHSTSWWKMSRNAYRLAEKQMLFNGGFRADVIISEDSFESGLAGWFLSKKYKCPIQLHIYDDFYDETYLDTTDHPLIYEWSTEYLLKRIKSVRTQTELQKQAVIEKNKKLEEHTEVLPNYYNLEAWRDIEPSFDLKDRYPQYKFIMVHISLMRRSSNSIELLTGSARMLSQYKTVGLIIVGNGPLRTKLEKQAIDLGIEKQVQFEPMSEEIVSYLKSAHLLLHLSENSAEDETILAAASVKLPIVALESGLAGQLFVDDESAQLCKSTEFDSVSGAVNRYLNENRERKTFALRAYEIVFEKISQDYDAYLEAYKNSISRCLLAETGLDN